MFRYGCGAKLLRQARSERLLAHARRPGVKKKANARGPLHFPAVPLTQANKRAGKHTRIVSEILSDVAKLDEFSAIKIDLAEFEKKKADLRAAIHRAAKKQRVHIATTSDESYLYVFRSALKSRNSGQGARKII
jgi:hypothetical protein